MPCEAILRAWMGAGRGRAVLSRLQLGRDAQMGMSLPHSKRPECQPTLCPCMCICCGVGPCICIELLLLLLLLLLMMIGAGGGPASC